MRNTVFALLAALCVSAGSGCAWRHGGYGGEKFQGGCERGCGYCGDPQSGACGAGGCANGNCGCSDGRCAASPVPDADGTRAAVYSQLGGPAGPPSPQVTYPYYTTRGPRDFFAAHPPSIGP